MSRLSRLIPKGIHFLFLLPLFFVLHGCTENFPLITLKEGLELLLQYELVAALLFGLALLFFRSVQKAAFYAFFLLSFQLLFGAVHDVLKEWGPALFFSKYIFLMVSAAAVFIWLLVYLRKAGASFRRPSVYLNTVLLFLLLVDAVTLGIRTAARKPNTFQAAAQANVTKRPNIYLIVLDEYAGALQLRDMFKFDNSAFEDSLRGRGFQVLTRTTSNYNYTPYSMASLFSMAYLEGINPNSSDFKNRKIVFDRINANRLTRTLGGMGYRFANHSLFDFAGKPPISSHSDFYLTGKRIITSQTFTSRVRRDLWYHVILDLNLNWAKTGHLNALKEEITEAYDKTIEEATDAGSEPKFVYSHFIMPHYPYLYDEHGNDVPFEDALQNSKERYLGFLKYGNGLVLKLIDEVQRRDTTKPVIILMSDHGYTKYGDGEGPRHYNFTNVINVCNAAPLPDSLSNVNLFRHLFNTSFDARLPLLKDSTVFLYE